MQEFTDRRMKEPTASIIGRSTVSFILVIFTHFALSVVPYFFLASSLLLQLSLSAALWLVVLGFGRWFKRLLGFYSSAPAAVFCNILFLWFVYFVFVRQATSYFIDVMFHVEVAMLFVGLCSIISSDPGFVNTGSLHTVDEIKAFEVDAPNEYGSIDMKRIRYCKSCKACVKGYDHHCPAFGNCIGQNNHVRFIVLLLGFLSTEATYIMCSCQFLKASHLLGGTRIEIGLAESLVVSTLLFALLQVLWQGFFMAWHVYCVCFNIKTDEWINWKKYPEFRVSIESQPGGSFMILRYANPYDKGIIQNVKEFLTKRD